MFEIFKHLSKNVISGIIISERGKGQKTNKVAKFHDGLYFLPLISKINNLEMEKLLKCCYYDTEVDF